MSIAVQNERFILTANCLSERILYIFKYNSKPLYVQSGGRS
jgi:hypothetical protein